MAVAEFRCTHCPRLFNSTAALGRHLQSVNAAHRRSEIANRTDVSTCHLNESCENDAEILEGLDESMSQVNISEETTKFYKQFKDEVVRLFTDTGVITPSLGDLSTKSRHLLRFCCNRRLTSSEVTAQYEHEIASSCDCPCVTELQSQFPTAKSFVLYVEKSRRAFVNSQGWSRAIIHTATGVNKTGVFRSALDVLLELVHEAGGKSSIVPFERITQHGERIFSTPVNSEAMREYEQESGGTIPVLCFDLYADSTTMSRSGSQSACVIRIRPLNVRGRSSCWRDVGIAPHLLPSTAISDNVRTFERAKLFQRFLFLLLEDAIYASKSGVSIDGSLYKVRLGVLVSDQPQERSFFALKAVGSFMDCSMCLMPSLTYEHDLDIDVEQIPDELLLLNSQDDVHVIQTSPDNAQRRNVVSTVARQLVVANSTVQSHSDIFRYTRSEINQSKQYLHRVSALSIPPALAAMHGLGTHPFRLYNSIGFDKLHTFDLGVARIIPDLAFTRFQDPSYNKGVLTKPKLVRIANKRFADLSRLHGTHILPFRCTPSDIHSSMTGSIRRSMTPFLWVSLLGLQPQTRPDDDMLLRASLMLNKFQVEWRGINVPFETGMRTSLKIAEIQSVAFDLGQLITAVLSLRVSTKLHRLMRHAADHLRDYGCARRGDTDANETLHKGTKASYRATNKKTVQLFHQVVAVRSIADCEYNEDVQMTEELEYTSSSSFHKSYLSQIVRNATVLPLSELDDASAEQTEELGENNHAVQAMLSDVHEILEHILPDDVRGAILQILNPITNLRCWNEIQQIRFEATFSWLSSSDSPSLRKHQVAYAGNNVRGAGRRFDAVEYSHENVIRKGILHLLVQRASSGSKTKIAIVRRLRECSAHPDNRNVVHEFGHIRYKYVIRSHGDVRLDCIPCAALRRVLPLVPDLHDISNRFSISQRPDDIPDTPGERIIRSFFVVEGVQYTALPEAEF